MSCDFQEIYIICQDKPVYLRRNRQEKVEIETESAIETCSISKEFHDAECRFIVFPITNISQADPQMTYLSSAIAIHRQSSSPNNLICVRLNEYKHQEICKKSATRGLFLRCSTSDESKKELLLFKNSEQGFQIYEVIKTSNSLYILRETQNGLEGSRENIYMQVIDTNSFSTLQDISGCGSPIFCMPDLTPVFHSYQAVRMVLEKLKDIAEVKTLLQIVDEHVIDMQLLTQSFKHPFVVVEGMDASGKTTLTEDLKKTMSFACCNISQDLANLRSSFDKYPEIVRRAYYSMGNYLIALDIFEKLKSSPVINDRFWHSTAAYGIANETSNEDLPIPDHAVYNWPSDLLKPTLVLFLQVSEEERKKRIRGRNEKLTDEELKLDKDPLFRQRLCNAYKRMKDPPCVEIDANGNKMEVRFAALKKMEEYNIHIQVHCTKL